MALINPSTAPQALDALEASLRTVFLQTGSALSSTTSDGAKLNSVRNHVDRALPEALKRWHNALNDLEAQLTDAKAVLHRDFAASRSRNLVQSSNASPASADSDTVMVEAPTQVEDASVQEAEDLQKMEDVQQLEKAAGAPSDPVDNTTAATTAIPPEAGNPALPTDPASEDPLQDAPKPDEPAIKGPPPTTADASAMTQALVPTTQPSAPDKPSPSTALNLDLSTTRQNPNSRSASPLPSIERPAAAASNLEDPGNDLADSDISAMLPGLMDFANDAMEDFASDPLFADGVNVVGQDGAMDGNADGVQDLFGAEAGSVNPFDGDASMGFDNFSFDDLAAQGAMAGGEDGGNATFDHSFFTEDFFDLEGAAGESGNGN